MTTFRDFRDNPSAIRMVNALLGLDMSELKTWSHFTQAALYARPIDMGGDYQPFIDRIENRAGTASTGELALLMAILFAMDYRWLAEKIAEESGRSFLRLMEYTSGDHSRAAAACIERNDYGPSPFDVFERERLAELADKLGALDNSGAIRGAIEALGMTAFSIRGLEAIVVRARKENGV